MSLPYKVSQKLIISGQYVEHYSYEKAYWVGWPRFKSYRPVMTRLDPFQAVQDSIRDDNVRRTRIKIRRLVNCNQDLVKFMTLTFDSSVPDLDSANRYFKNFILKIKRKYPDFKYLAVPEFQSDWDYYGRLKPQRGSVHYHLLCNLPFIKGKELVKLWGNGFAFIRKVDNVDNLGAYICKYLGKANFDSRYFSKRKFFYSFNLLRSVVVDNFYQVRHIINNLPLKLPLFVLKTFAVEFWTKYLGVVKYKQYKLASFVKVGST